MIGILKNTIEKYVNDNKVKSYFWNSYIREIYFDILYIKYL